MTFFSRGNVRGERGKWWECEFRLNSTGKLVTVVDHATLTSLSCDSRWKWLALIQIARNSTRNLSSGFGVKCRSNYFHKTSSRDHPDVNNTFVHCKLLVCCWIFEDENQDRFIIVGFRELRTSSSRTTLVHALCCVAFFVIFGPNVKEPMQNRQLKQENGNNLSKGKKKSSQAFVLSLCAILSTSVAVWVKLGEAR